MSRPHGCRASRPPESPSPAPGDPSDDTTVLAVHPRRAARWVASAPRRCGAVLVLALLLCSVALLLPTWAHAQTAATITSTDFTSAPRRGENDDTYRIDDAIEVTVAFSAAVTVTGTPQFALNVGGGLRRADYESGSGSTDLVFSYTVVEGDEATDGVAVEKDEIALNGGTIAAGGTAATLTYGEVAADPAHKVDGIRPIFVSAETTADGTEILVTFSEHLESASPAAFQVYDGSADDVRPDVERVRIVEHVATLMLNRPIRYNDSLTLGIGQGAAWDLANNWNPLALNNPIVNNVPINTNAVPSFGVASATREVAENSDAGTDVGDPVTATDADGHTLTYTLEGTDAASFQIVSASGQIQTKAGVTYDFETKSRYSVIVKADDNNGGTDTINVTINLTDVNEATPTIDTVTPVSDPGTDDTYGLGDTIEVEMTFYQVVNVTGVPRIKLRIGGGAAVNQKWADYASGTGTTKLLFAYVVQAADMDDNGISIEADELELNGGTIQNAAGVDAWLGYHAPGQQDGHKVDGSIAATAAQLAPSNLTVTLENGDVKLNWNAPDIDDASVDGYAIFRANPRLTPPAPLAIHLNNTGNTNTTYLDTEPVAGTRNTYRVAAWRLGVGSVNSNSAAVDVPPPSVSSVALTSRPGSDNTYAIGDSVEATVTFDQEVTVTGTPQFALNVGGELRRADYESGSGSTDLLFSYTVVEDDEATDGVAVEKDEIAALNGDTITATAGGTAATLTYDGVAANPAHKVDGIRPTLESAETTEDGTQVLVTFSENLREASLAAFQVGGGVDPPDVASRTIEENVVTLVLDRAIVSGDSHTLTIGEAAVRDAANNGNPVSLNNPIVNNVPADGTPTIDIDLKDSVEVLEGNEARLEVRLGAEPVTDVTVTVMSNNAGKVTVMPASLAFTTTNWGDSQDLTITPAEDSDSSDETVTLTLSGTGLTTTTVTVDVADDEMSLTLPPSVSLTEGGTATIDVTLASAPSARFPRTVTVSSEDTAAVTVAPSSLTFTSMNWDEAKTVTVTGKQDGNTTGERVTISFSARDVQNETVTVHVTDDDGGGGDGGGGDGDGGGGDGEAVGPPSLPRDLTAMAGDQAVQLSWRRPADDGGARIVRYEYRQQEGDGPFGAWQIIREDPPPTDHTVTGLTNGTSYTFQVRAVNSREASPPSEPASATPVPELAPFEVEIVGVPEVAVAGESYELTAESDAEEALVYAWRVAYGGTIEPDDAQMVVWTAPETAVVAWIRVDATREEDGATAGQSAYVRVEVPAPPTTLALSHDAAPAEGAGTVTVTATLDNPAPTTGMTVTLTTGGTAMLDTDYTLSSTTITLAAGETTGTVTITVIDDAEDDDGETIVLNAASTAPALTAEPLTLTIEDNDVTPVPALPLLGHLLLALGLTAAGSRWTHQRQRAPPAA